MKILIAEFDPKIQTFLEKATQYIFPYAEIKKCITGYEASIQARLNHFDLFITEVFLPDLRGDLLSRFIEYDCYKIGMTRGIATSDIRIVFDDFLLKPITQDELYRALLSAHINCFY